MKTDADIFFDPLTFETVESSLRVVAGLAAAPPLAVPVALPETSKQLYEDISGQLHRCFIELAECLTACADRLNAVVEAYQ